jgi:hypothetical protein
MLSQAIGESSLYDTRILVRLSDLDLKATIQLKTIPDSSLDKGEWQHIWRIYNLVQEYCDVKFSKVEAEPGPSNRETETDEEVLKYFDPELHHIVKLLIRNNVPFNHEGSYFLENEKGLVAEAAIGFHDFRIVISPISDFDRKAFEQDGYTVVEPGDFNFQMIGL